MKLSGKLAAWLTASWDIKDVLEEPIAEVALSKMVFVPVGRDYTNLGWIRIGSADISATLESYDKTVQAKIEALRTEQITVRVQAEKRVNDLEGQIQNLLALPAAVEAQS